MRISVGIIVRRLFVLALILALASPLMLPVGASAASAGDPALAATYDNLASGKPPVITLATGDQLQTSKENAIAARLTDGVIGDGNWSANRALYVDFLRNTARDVDIDLGGTSTVKELTFRAMQDSSAAIYLPDKVTFSLSNDGGQTWAIVGTLTSSQAEIIDAKQSLFRLGGLNYQANKVRVSFTVNIWVFVDELQVMGKTGIVDGAVPPPAGGGSNPGEPVDHLASGKIPTVSLISGDAAQSAVEQAKMARLTDNEVGNGDWSGNRAKYVDFFRNIARNVVVDLGETSTVTEISFRVLQDPSAGIGLPSNVSFSLSDDGGSTWRYLGTATIADAVSVDARHKVFKMSGLNYIADQVRIGFDVNVWVFADELRVNGQTGIAEGAVQAPDLGYVDPYEGVNAFPAPGSEQVRGTRNDYLVYAGWHTGGTIKESKTVEKLLPAVAYVNWDGQIKDMMFDSFTFLPYRTASSGRMLSDNAPSAAKAGNKQDWQEYIDFLYDDADQLAALNEAVGMAKEALNRPDYQAKVKIALPRPIPIQNNFGTVDGAVLSFDPSTVGEQQALANRVAAATWYIDEVIGRFDPDKYPHLRLDGFYWLTEAIEALPNNAEETMLKQISEYIHEKDKIFYWIPFYQANGFFKWKSLGFDWAVLQPNYAFSEGAPESRPTDAAKLARWYGLGLEMEIHWNGLINESDRQKYLRYLDQGATFGYMNDSVRAWYMGTATLEEAFVSRVPSQREIYEKTYASVSGVYPDFPDHTPPVSTDDSAAGWHNTDQTVRIIAADDFSGVARTFIGVDNAAVAEGNTAVIGEEGKHQVNYYSVDGVGNQETMKQTEVWIDKSAPAFTLAANGTLLLGGEQFQDNEQIALDLQSVDPLSGVAEQTIEVDGEAYTPGSLLDWAGRLGEHEIRVTVSDHAGNRSVSLIRISVTTSIPAIKSLVDRYFASGDLNLPLREQLSIKLKNAEEHMAKGKITEAVHDMNIFLDRIAHWEDYQDHTGKITISDAAKAALTADANAVIQSWSN